VSKLRYFVNLGTGLRPAVITVTPSIPERIVANLGQISKHEKKPYYPSLSFLTLTAVITYRKVRAISFGVSNNILNVVVSTTSTIEP
jgi:hypothetical protein